MLLGTAAGLAGLVASGGMRAATREHPSKLFMRKAAADLFAAHKLGTVSAFQSAIERHADIGTIADYSLGQYLARLPASQRPSYYAGVGLFMARYFADQTRTYRIAKWDIGEAIKDRNGEFLITTRVTLFSGSAYNVVWRLSPRGKSYRITDVKVAGFSLVYLQRGIFVSFVQKRKGDVGQLVAVLNNQ
jgi:ABC-type transporter MlaC component